MNDSLCLWDALTTPPQLVAGEVQVICIEPKSFESTTESLRRLLSLDEIERLERFRFDKDKLRFLVTRSLLRKILGFYLQRPPQDLCFNYNPHGKPALLDAPTLQFNVTHSESVTLIAIAYNFAIGIDVESMKKERPIDALVKRYFAPQENQYFQGLRVEERNAVFFQSWTCKEALLKAVGVGIAHSLNRVLIGFDANRSPKILAWLENQENIADWFLYVLDPLPDYVAVLAVKGQPQQIKKWLCSTFTHFQEH